MTGILNLGGFTAGEIPRPLVVIIGDEAGAPIDDLTGYAAKLVWERRAAAGATAEEQTRDATITDGPQAEATYIWVADDFDTPGLYRAQMWVGNGTQRYASQVIAYTVSDGPGTPPTI